MDFQLNNSRAAKKRELESKGIVRRIKKILGRCAATSYNTSPEPPLEERKIMNEVAIAIEEIGDEEQLLRFFLGESYTAIVGEEYEDRLVKYGGEAKQARLAILKVVLSNGKYAWASHELVCKARDCFSGEEYDLSNALLGLSRDGILIARPQDYGLISFCI